MRNRKAGKEFTGELAEKTWRMRLKRGKSMSDGVKRVTTGYDGLRRTLCGSGGKYTEPKPHESKPCEWETKERRDEK